MLNLAFASQRRLVEKTVAKIKFSENFVKQTVFSTLTALPMGSNMLLLLSGCSAYAAPLFVTALPKKKYIACTDVTIKLQRSRGDTWGRGLSQGVQTLMSVHTTRSHPTCEHYHTGVYFSAVMLFFLFFFFSYFVRMPSACFSALVECVAQSVRWNLNCEQF